MFDITLSDNVEYEDQAPFYRGVLQLGNFTEEFLAAASLWKAERYRRQWREAARSLAGGAERVAFITSFVHPDAVNVLWPAWREGGLVYIQNQLSLPENRRGLLDPDSPALQVGDRAFQTANGPIPEWIVPIDEIAAFAAS